MVMRLTRLLTDVTKLIAKAAQLQATLTDKGKLAEAIALEAAVIAIKEVEQTLLQLHPEETVGQILIVAAEATLQLVEKKIEAELLKLESGSRKKRDIDGDALKIALLTDVTKLLARAELLSTTLKDKGLLVEAIALEAAVLAVKEVEVQLLNLHPEDTVGQILLVVAEATLKEVEKKLDAQVKKLEASATTVTKRDIKSDLVTKAETLLIEAYALETQLKGTGKAKEALELEGEIAAVELAVTALKGITGGSLLEQAAILLAEQALQVEEARLQTRLTALKAA